MFNPINNFIVWKILHKFTIQIGLKVHVLNKIFNIDYNDIKMTKHTYPYI